MRVETFPFKAAHCPNKLVTLLIQCIMHTITYRSRLIGFTLIAVLSPSLQA